MKMPKRGSCSPEFVSRAITSSDFFTSFQLSVANMFLLRFAHAFNQGIGQLHSAFLVLDTISIVQLKD